MGVVVLLSLRPQTKNALERAAQVCVPEAGGPGRATRSKAFFMLNKFFICTPLSNFRELHRQPVRLPAAPSTLIIANIPLLSTITPRQALNEFDDLVAHTVALCDGLERVKPFHRKSRNGALCIA